MIILDTNVISELARPGADARVRAWFRLRRPLDFYTTAITEAELRYGVAITPAGTRKSQLASYVDGALSKYFAGRILPFDSGAARAWAEIVASRRRAGRPASTLDAQIAAIARVHGAALATRNVRDFEGCGIEVLDPWSQDT